MLYNCKCKRNIPKINTLWDLYNALAWRLRESLAQINGIELLTIKDTALQLVFTKKKGKE